MRPSSTKLYSSSRVCRCSGAASARGDIGCSTSEKRSPASGPSIMKRTPMLPRKPSCPSSGPTTFTPAAVVSMARSFRLDSSVARKYTTRRRDLSIFMDDRYVRSKASLPDEAPRRARGADAPADHRERGRAARGARPRADLDQRHRRARGRAPLDRLPPLPGRGGAVRRLLVALARGEPAAGPGRLGGDRGSRPSAPRRRCASCTRSTAAPRRCTTSLLRDEPLVPVVQRLLRDFYGYLRAIQDVLMAGRGLRGRARAPDARGDRPRARVPDVALADPRAGADRRRRRRADVPRSSRALRVAQRVAAASSRNEPRASAIASSRLIASAASRSSRCSGSRLASMSTSRPRCSLAEERRRADAVHLASLVEPALHG